MITFREKKSLKDLDSVSLAAMLRQHFVENFPMAEVQRLDEAIQVASYLHRMDVRRGGRGKMPNPPYIEHCLRVALRLVTHFGVRDSDVIIAAVLHDTVEDHPFEFSDFEGVPLVTREDVARGMALEFVSRTFGFGVAKLVDYVSNPILPEGSSKSDKLSSYQAHVRAATSQSESALVIKVSDVVDNAGSLHHHYNYDDPKVRYFIDRYTPVLDLYSHRLLGRDTDLFDAEAAYRRICDIEEQFTKFRAGLDKSASL